MNARKAGRGRREPAGRFRAGFRPANSKRSSWLPREINPARVRAREKALSTGSGRFPAAGRPSCSRPGRLSTCPERHIAGFACPQRHMAGFTWVGSRWRPMTAGGRPWIRKILSLEKLVIFRLVKNCDQKSWKSLIVWVILSPKYFHRKSCGF